MKIVIAPDSFKESMSALEACAAIEKGIHAVDPNATCIKIPMADGGEGTLASICDALDGECIQVPTYTMFQEPIMVPICVCKELVVIESASCIGLDLIAPEQRNIYKANTYGLGILIKEALQYHPKRIMICLGGSATNDMGVGMLQALGVQFLNANNELVMPIPACFADIKKVDVSTMDTRLQNVEFIVACDVQNRLCGEQGASYIFGPQKGASSEDVKVLDQLLYQIGKLASKTLGVDMLDVAGGGAAGGLGAALYGFLQAKLQPGVEIVKQLVSLDTYISEADVVITGEGSLDGQTLRGKTCYGVAKSAHTYGIPVLVFAGKISEDANALYNHGVTAYFPIVHQLGELSEVLQTGPINLARSVENVYRIWMRKR